MTIQELEQAIALYGKEIYSFCPHLAKNKMAAEELYQDTFLTATEQTARLNTDGNPRSYFLSVSLRLWKNRKRKIAWRQRVAPTKELAEDALNNLSDPSCAGSDTLSDYLEKEQRLMVRKAVSRLDEKYRIPVLLYYMEEMSIAEVAAVMQIPQGTVKSRLDTARKRLESELEGYFNE